jgi:acetate kinase
MSSLYLLFEVGFDRIVYCAVNQDNEAVYEGTCLINEWSPKNVKKQFDAQILSKLRGHGKVFTGVGIVVPYAPAHYKKPEPATAALYKQIVKTVSQQQFLTPVFYLLQASQSSWTHLPHYFLFDTCLSSELAREVMIPPFDYDFTKQHALYPAVLHSYGHRANLVKNTLEAPIISLYVGTQSSVALFKHEKLLDASVSYSPISPIMGLYGPGALDIGFTTDLSNSKSFSLSRIIYEHTGIYPMTERRYSLDDLCQIAGISPRKGTIDMDSLPIESMEWIELSLKTFIRSLRHAIASMLIHPSGPTKLIINTSVIPKSCGLWSALVDSLSGVKISYEPTSLLQVASGDLIQFAK